LAVATLNKSGLGLKRLARRESEMKKDFLGLDDFRPLLAAVELHA